MSRFKLSLEQLLMLFLLLLPYAVFAQFRPGLNAPPAPPGTAQGDLIPAIYTIVNIFLGLAGLAAAAVLIYGGVVYIMSRGDTTAADTGKRTILYAVIGLVVIGLSAALVQFVIGAIGVA